MYSPDSLAEKIVLVLERYCLGDGQTLNRDRAHCLLVECLRMNDGGNQCEEEGIDSVIAIDNNHDGPASTGSGDMVA